MLYVLNVEQKVPTRAKDKCDIDENVALDELAHQKKKIGNECV